jgi:hypothetical protein
VVTSSPGPHRLRWRDDKHLHHACGRFLAPHPRTQPVLTVFSL